MKDRQRILSRISKNDDLSAFQKAVLRAIVDIPIGEVRSYRWVAGRIGKPKASRAVGNALNANPYPIVVPCHRIIRSDGTIGGYASGVRRKRRLLEREGADCA